LGFVFELVVGSLRLMYLLGLVRPGCAAPAPVAGPARFGSIFSSWGDFRPGLRLERLLRMRTQLSVWRLQQAWRWAERTDEGLGTVAHLVHQPQQLTHLGPVVLAIGVGQCVEPALEEHRARLFDRRSR